MAKDDILEDGLGDSEMDWHLRVELSASATDACLLPSNWIDSGEQAFQGFQGKFRLGLGQLKGPGDHHHLLSGVAKFKLNLCLNLSFS